MMINNNLQDLGLVEWSLKNLGFTFERKELNRPWGGFWAISNECKEKFITEYFPEYADLIKEDTPMSPKILAVAPNKRLSWQYHHRRSELWKVIHGEVGIARSTTDDEGDSVTFKEESIICLNEGERHRLVGLEEWAVVAEIWIHTDPANPSNEDDIVRVQDDFGR